jgi:hypothetical protein
VPLSLTISRRPVSDALPIKSSATKLFDAAPGPTDDEVDHLKAVIRWLSTAGVVGSKYPMVGIFVACCARATSGHAAAPPSIVMNSRRLMGSPQAEDHTLPQCGKSRIVHHSILAHPTSATGSFSIEPPAASSPVHVGSGSNSDRILCAAANGGQCHKPP